MRPSCKFSLCVRNFLMMTKVGNIETQSDHRADKRSLVFFIACFLASLFIHATSLQIEAMRNGVSIDWQEPWLREIASHFIILLFLPLMPKLLNFAPPSRKFWRRTFPIYVLAFIIFTTVHIVGMISIRKIIYPLFLGTPYDYDFLNLINWVYEIRKDAFTFAMIVFGYALSRAAEQTRLAETVAREEARQDQRIVLKSGGRTIFLHASEIISAKAAANYVDITTEHKTHLARMTLSTLENLLNEANSDHIRIHRSSIVKLKAIAEIVPSGQGDADVHLTNGTIITCSRRYREALNEAVSRNLN